MLINRIICAPCEPNTISSPAHPVPSSFKLAKLPNSSILYSGLITSILQPSSIPSLSLPIQLALPSPSPPVHRPQVFPDRPSRPSPSRRGRGLRHLQRRLRCWSVRKQYFRQRRLRLWQHPGNMLANERGKGLQVNRTYCGAGIVVCSCHFWIC